MQRYVGRSRWVGAICLVLVLVFGVWLGGGEAAVSAKGKPPLGPFPTKKKVTLKVWDFVYSPGQGPYDALKALDQQFMKLHPNVKISHQGFPYNVFWPTKVQSVIAAKQGPDVISAGEQFPTIFPGLWPLRDLLSPSQLKNISALNTFEARDPSLHVLPYGTYAYTWLYNKKLFAQAGLSGPPATWQDLLTDCDKLKAAHITPIAAGFQDGPGANWYVSYGFASQLFTNTELNAWNQGKIGWTYPKMSQAWDDLAALNARGCFSPGAVSKVNGDAQQDFAAGKAAMLYWVAGNWKAYDPSLGTQNVGVFRFPLLPNSPGYETDSGPSWFWGITRFTKNCRVAFEYLSFLYSPKAQQTLYADSQGDTYPNLIGAKVNPIDPRDAQVLSWLNDRRNHSGPHDASAQERQAWIKAYPQFLAGQISRDDALKSIQAARQAGQTFQPAPRVSSPQCN